MEIPDVHVRKIGGGRGYIGAHNLAVQMLSEPHDFESIASTVTHTRSA